MKIIDNKRINEFKNYLTEDEKSEATLEKYIRDIKAFAAWAEGREINKGVVIEYKNSLTESYAPASINSMLSSLNSFFSFAGWFDCKVKQIKIQRRIFISEDKELTEDEYKRLLKTAKEKGDERLYYLIETIAATGIRVSELKFITAEAVVRGEADINCKGKQRRIFLPSKLCAALKKYIKEKKIKKGCVFITKNGKPLNRTNIWTYMKKLCKDANVSEKKVFPHNLRHLFARTFYSIKKDIVRLADILGHSGINTTRIYTAESGNVHRKQLQAVGLKLLIT